MPADDEGRPVRYDDPNDEITYVQRRAEQAAAAHAENSGVGRRAALRAAAASVPALTAAAMLPPGAARAKAPEGATVAALGASTPAVGNSPIVKPLPTNQFVDFGTNAEMRWDGVDFGYLTPNERFFVRDHTSTPLIDARTWRLGFYGSGLRGKPDAAHARTIGYRELVRLPSRTVTAAIECAGNGRSLFDIQQHSPAPGTQWGLGAIGVARWTGVPLSLLLALAGLSRHAVDVMPIGLDKSVVTNGVDNGHVRRPMPVAKALDDVLVVYAMNGRPLPPDHGGPVRILVPGWVGVTNIKWVGSIEVADHPLYSTWNTTQYRLVGGDYPADSPPITDQVVKSAFELARGATVRRDRPVTLRGRSWSGTSAIAKVEVSTDGGAHWQRARLHGPNLRRAWAQWRYQWHPRHVGATDLLARATDSRGRTQPLVTPFNTNGYLFDAVVRHPVTVAA